ncbi:unnamed protein product [Staurois parvus]|uniref:Uncharacterized protein n=1 Tax=Staurois parvus TaxID=386267 RepID=A0ABN9GBR8_9NEOB|nr:unnamed protein product [Staurois parvus]
MYCINTRTVFLNLFLSKHPLKLWTVLRHPILKYEKLF